MRKSLIVIGIFIVLAAVALVFGLQQFGVENITGITHPNPLQATLVPSIQIQFPMSFRNFQESNIQFEWKLGNPYVYEMEMAKHFWI